MVGNAGEGEVSVPATAGQVWNAISTVDWIDVISGDAGTGRGTVRFRYADNNTGVARTGVILIAGEEYEVRQAARQLVEVKVRGEGEGGAVVGGTVGGAGVYDRGAKVTLTAVAADGYEFAGWTGLDGEGAVVTQNPLILTADVDRTIAVSFRRIPMYAVNGETVRGGTVKQFAAPEPRVDGATKFVCKGTSAFPEKGTSFQLKITSDVSFEWDLWETNYLLTVETPAHGRTEVEAEGGGGEIVSATSRWVKAGETMTLTAVADNGYVFFRWTGMVGADVLGGPQPRFNANSFDDGCGAPGGRALPSGTVWSFAVDAPTTVGAVFGVFNDTLSDALDAKDLVFTTGGDASWAAVVDATTTNGYTSVRSGAIGKESETWLETTVSGPGTLAFDWRVDCEKDDGGAATWDRLSVFVNGVEAARIDGRTDWQRVTLPVGGKATVRWSFYRDDWDENAAAHENCGWIDNVRLQQ